MTISGIAGMRPDINVYRHGACGLAIAPRFSGSGRLIAGNASACLAIIPATIATSKPPMDENACVYPSTFSR